MNTRILPHNTEAEESLLSAVFIDPKNLEDIENISADDFYKKPNCLIWRSIQKLYKKHIPVDLVTVANDLQETGKLTAVGGMAYIAKIADSAPVALNAKYYATIISELAAARDMILTAMKIVDAGYQVRDVEDYISRSQAKILQVQTTNSVDNFTDMDTLMEDAVRRIRQAQTTSIAAGVNFGFTLLDPMLHIAGSKLCLIAGRPGIGKTALALSMAKSAARQDIKTGIISIEMDKESLADRLLSMESDINSLCFYAQNSISDNSLLKLEESAYSLSSLPILIDDGQCTIEDVKRKCRKMKKAGCELLFIDQLSKISGDRNKKKYDLYTDNCNDIALLKKELHIPIFLLCQINRELEKRSDKTPTLADLKQTGALEEDADIVFLVHRPGYYDHAIDASLATIILAKNRQGATGEDTTVNFNIKRGMFRL